MEQSIFSLHGQVGIVTGAGQGLGKVFCHAFARAGANVVVTDINPTTGATTAREVQDIGRESLFIPTDVRQQASVKEMVRQTMERFGRIDFLMNNAGIVKWGAAEDVTEEEWAEIDTSPRSSAGTAGCSPPHSHSRQSGQRDCHCHQVPPPALTDSRTRTLAPACR